MKFERLLRLVHKKDKPVSPSALTEEGIAARRSIDLQSRILILRANSQHWPANRKQNDEKIALLLQQFNNSPASEKA